MALVDIPTSSFVEVEQRALQGTHDFVFAIGLRKPEPIGRTTPLPSRAGSQEGSTSAQTFMKTTSRMILSSPTFRKTSSVSRRCDRFACHTGSPWCQLWTRTLRTCVGTGTAPMTRRSSIRPALASCLQPRLSRNVETRLPVMSEVTDLDFFYGGAIRDNVDHPHSFLMHPVYPLQS
jgi:hypothetical protein